VEKKRISGEAYNINKRTIYIVPKSKIESRVHYFPEPARGQAMHAAKACVTYIHRVTMT